MIRKLTPTILTDNSILVVSGRFREEIGKLRAEDTFITDLLKLCADSTETLKASLARSQKNRYTRLVKEKDDARDDDFLSLKNHLIANHTSRDGGKKAAALKLSGEIKRINYLMHSQGYLDQSADLERLFSRLDQGEYPALLEQVAAAGIYRQLKESQREFEAVYNQKAGEAEDLKDVPLLRDARSGLIDCLEGIISYMNLREQINPGDYAAPNEVLDQILGDVHATERSRLSREKEADG